MIHKGWWDVYVRDWFNHHWDFPDFQQKELKNFTTDLTWLSVKEKKKFNDGRDVYLNSERMWKVLEN